MNIIIYIFELKQIKMTNIYCTLKNAERKALKADKAKKVELKNNSTKTEVVSCKKPRK